MSVSIATMGMFNQCCGSRTGGGGAPPYRRDEERIKPRVLVTKFEIETINATEKMFENISVKLVNEED